MATNVDHYLAGVPISLARPEAVLPSQHFGARRKQAPEQRLMMAVLRDALACLEKYRLATNDRGRRLFREAERWFLANEAHWPYSFESICGFLDLDSNAVRMRLLCVGRGNQRIGASRQREAGKQRSWNHCQQRHVKTGVAQRPSERTIQ